jgi:hypothetical protein
LDQDMENPNRFRLYGLKPANCGGPRSGGTLSVVPAGHPKLKNDLRRPSIEEIGSRATIFELEGLGREKRKFFAASLAEVPQGVQCAALHQRAQLLDSLVRQDIGVDDDSNDLACPFGDAGVGDDRDRPKTPRATQAGARQRRQSL